MGTVAEAALRCSTVVRAVLQRLPVEDLFLCARYDDLWERVAATLLCQKLSFFALLQDDDVGKAPSDEGALVEELRWRLGLAEKVCRRPASAIVFSCCDRPYEARAVASCFPDGTSVAQVDVLCPVNFQRCGIQERRTTRLCVLVLFEKPDTEFQCEWLSCVGGHSVKNVHTEPSASREVASLQVNAKRRRCSCRSRKVTYRHPKTGQPASFALYASSAFNRRTFRRPPSLYHVASCVLGTARVRVLKHSPGSRYGVPVCWGTTVFGGMVRATSIKYRGSTTDVQMSKHLSGIRTEFGNVTDALVLFFQEEVLNAPATEVIWSVFSDAAVVLGMATSSLALDVNRVAFNLEAISDTELSKCLETPVVVAVLET
ncbi:hypothetical protein HPB50_017552 [Hyalomma asiaticum]|uniref:Uncharacterized protein n=1 Tax=Hyalomma asiaticum TaxID=266040 RepID=A0ACB7RTW3_HYAAI|nr:hypothetical protein HPB50_017552 [Hyalomma asiaticum]